MPPKKRGKTSAGLGAKKKGDPQPCRHRVFKEDAAGAWICTACGAEVPKRKIRPVKQKDDDYSAEAD